MIVLSFKHLYFSGLRIILYYGCHCFSVCQEAVMVDCLCVWLYCTLGIEQLSKATVLLGCKLELGENYCCQHVEACRFHTICVAFLPYTLNPFNMYIFNAPHS